MAGQDEVAASLAGSEEELPLPRVVGNGCPRDIFGPARDKGKLHAHLNGGQIKQAFLRVSMAMGRLVTLGCLANEI